MGSLLELPDAPPQPWIAPDEHAPRGRVVTTTLPSTALAEDRPIGVYLPANLADSAGPHPYVIVFDGEVHGLKPDPLVPVPVILDNLIAQARLPPTLAVLVASGSTRTRDLSMSPAFCEFLADELAPWLRQEHRASADPADVTLAGSSLGGLTAAYCAFHRPHSFANALSQSGSFWFAPGAWDSQSPHTLETGGFIREVIAAPRKPVRFWLEVGRFEGGGTLPGANQVAQNRHLRDVLRLQGYEVDYHEYSGGHDYLSWRGSFADGLLALASGARLRHAPPGATAAAPPR
jgi:enterochelin esterase-like enzyme